MIKLKRKLQAILKRPSNANLKIKMTMKNIEIKNAALMESLSTIYDGLYLNSLTRNQNINSRFWRNWYYTIPACIGFGIILGNIIFGLIQRF